MSIPTIDCYWPVYWNMVKSIPNIDCKWPVYWNMVMSMPTILLLASILGYDRVNALYRLPLASIQGYGWRQVYYKLPVLTAKHLLPAPYMHHWHSYVLSLLAISSSTSAPAHSCYVLQYICGIFWHIQIF